MVGDQRLGGVVVEFQQGDRALVGELRHQRRPAGDHRKAFRCSQRTRHHRGGDLAHRMTDDPVRLDSIVTPQRSQRQLHTHEDRLDPYRTLHRLTVGDDVVQRKSKLRNKVRLQIRDRSRERRLIGK